MNVYVASDAGNLTHPKVVKMLRELGHHVFDFLEPGPAGEFSWSRIDKDYWDWDPRQAAASLHHPLAQAEFARQSDALRTCDCCLMLCPAGRDAHMAAGFAVGMGKRLYIYLATDQIGLAYRAAAKILFSRKELHECFAAMPGSVIPVGEVLPST